VYTVHFGDYVFEMVPNGYVIMEEKYIEIDLVANDLKLDYIEQIISNPENTKVIKLYFDDSLISTFTKYNYYERILKLPHQMLSDYDQDGNPIEVDTDIIKVTIRTARASDTLNQIQATMEYIAIMADIDIDEEL